MPRNESQHLGTELAQIKRAIKDLQSGRLQNASMHGSRLYIYDDEGSIREVIGNQGDGSYGSRVVQSPPQPTTTAPILPDDEGDERVPNVFPVEWDGNIVQGTVPVVHGRVDVWTQEIESESDADPEQAKLAGSIRDRQGGATSVVVKGSGLKAVWLQMVGADRVTKGEFSEPSFVTVSARVDAQDIADRINDFADGELDDAAYDNLMARLAEFLHVRADQIDVNSLAADSAFIGLLETAGIVISNEAGGRRFEVSGDGFRLTDTETDQVMAQLGTQTDDLITLHDSETGEPTISLGQDGGLSARHISSADDPTLGGKPLFGPLYDTPKWHAASSGMAAIGQGVVAQHLRSFNGETSTAQTGTAVAHLEANLVQGRYYRIRCHGFQAGDNGPYYMEAYYTTSQDRATRPALPTSSSVRMGQQAAMQPSTGAANLSFDFVYPATTAERIRVLFVVGRFDGNRMNFGSSLRHNARFTIEDLGPMTGSQGHTLWRTPASTTDNIPSPPEMLRQTYPVAQTATYSFNSSTGVCTRLYTGGQARFGTWTVTGQTHFTVVQYQPWSQAGTPRRADVSFRVGRWATTRGNIVRNWLPSFSGTPATFHIDDLTSLETQRNVGLGDIRGATLSESQQLDLADRPNASLVLGGTGWENAGYAASGIFSTSGATAGLSTELESS